MPPTTSPAPAKSRAAIEERACWHPIATCSGSWCGSCCCRGRSARSLYRMASFLTTPGAQRQSGVRPVRRAGDFAKKAFGVLDWVPCAPHGCGLFPSSGTSRMASIAGRLGPINGRTRLPVILLASGGGALGVRLGVCRSMNPVKCSNVRKWASETMPMPSSCRVLLFGMAHLGAVFLVLALLGAAGWSVINRSN